MAPRTAKRRRSARSKAWIPASLTATLFLGGYVAADLVDIAPGVLTLQGDWPDPDPVPTPKLPSTQEPQELSLSDSAPIPAADEVQKLLDTFLDTSGVGPEPGVLITDGLTGEVLAESDADEPKVPASTTKLLTAVAALDVAGATFKFSTEVIDGARDDEEAVTIVGSGDLTLAEDEGDEDAVIGRGGVKELAERTADHLKKHKRTKVSDVVVDESLWEGEREAPRWAESDFNDGWIIPLSPMAIDLGRVEGQLTRTSRPARDVGDTFAEHLEDAGITVSGKVRTGTAQPSGEVAATVESAPLADLVEYMLVYSDNVLAEAIGRLAAVEDGKEGSFEGAEEAITASLNSLDVPTEGLVLADTSGLSSVNKISPRTLTAVMGAISADHPELLGAVRGLPVAGLEGTLKNRMRDTAAAGTVAAKTGSLKVVASIAGQVVTSDGRLLHFTIMTSDWSKGLPGAREAIDALLTDIAECGCGQAEGA